MGIFRRKKENRAEGYVETEGSLLSALLGGGGLITKKEAMEIPALSSCINLIADRLAVLPIKLYKRSGEKPEEIRNDKRVSLLNYDTGDTLNATEMRKRWVRDYFLGKGAYTYIERNSFGEIIGLYYVDEDNVSVISSPDPIHKKYTISVNGRTYFPHEFVKIFRNTDGKGKGKSIVEENNTALSVAFNTLKLENTIVRKGGNKRGFIEAERRLSDEAIKAIKEAWRVMYSNTLDNTDNVVVLNDGAKFHESSNSSVEMQLNQNKLSNSNEICKLFCMPPEILTGRASESSVSLFVQNCLTPVINAIEAALDTDLLLEREKGDCYFALDTTELTRGDFTSRMNGYAVALQNNVMQLDEIREREDLPPLGFNYIKLGLQDVLLDPKTMQIYTPNTKELVSLDGGKVLTEGGKGDIIEERGKPYHDEKGRFASADGSSVKSVDKSGESGIMESGAYSGAKKTEGWQSRHGELMYEEIRHRTTDVKSIAKHTPFKESAVEEIKQHMFFKEHEFADGSIKRFDSDFDQAQAWDRLSRGKGTKADIEMLKHEYVELTQMRLHGYVYETAHDIANSKHNWAKILIEEMNK